MKYESTKECTTALGNLRAALSYNPITGELLWSNAPPRYRRSGAKAGHIRTDGYRSVMLNGIEYPEHRVAWAIFYGSWPTDEIDHINGLRADNRIENLRVVTRRQNECNKPRHRAGCLPGARQEPRCINRWRASITVDGVEKYLGLFHSEVEAHAAYMNERRKIEEAGK